MSVTPAGGATLFSGNNSARLTVGSVIGATLCVATAGELFRSRVGLGVWLDVASGRGVEANGIATLTRGISRLSCSTIHAAMQMEPTTRRTVRSEFLLNMVNPPISLSFRRSVQICLGLRVVLYEHLNLQFYRFSIASCPGVQKLQLCQTLLHF